MIKKAFSSLLIFSLISCTTTLVSKKKHFEKENFKVGKYHQFKTDDGEYYGKIDSISQDKIYLSYKEKPKEVVEISKIKKAKKYSVGKTIIYPVLGYTALTSAAFLLLINYGRE